MENIRYLHERLSLSRGIEGRSEKIERSLLNILNITQLFNQFLLHICTSPEEIMRDYKFNNFLSLDTHTFWNGFSWKIDIHEKCFRYDEKRVRDESRNRQSRNFFYETDNFPFINFRSVTFRKRKKESHFKKGASNCDVTRPLAWYLIFEKNFRKKWSQLCSYPKFRHFVATSSEDAPQDTTLVSFCVCYSYKIIVQTFSWFIGDFCFNFIFCFDSLSRLFRKKRKQHKINSQHVYITLQARH